VAVYADSGHVDLALPAAVPIGSLISPIVDILAAGYGPRDESVAAAYRLSLPGDTALNPSKTLAQIGIRDGTALILTKSSVELVAPCFDDEAEAISTLLAATARPWTQWTARLTAAMAASWLAGTSAVVLIRTAFYTHHVRRIDAAGVAAALGCIALLAATVSHRMFGDRIAGVMLGVVASGFAALAGLLGVPGGPGAPNTLLAATAAAATSIVAIQVMRCGAAIFTAMACFAAAAAAAAMIGAITAVPLEAIGAVSAAISLGLLEASARLSVMLAGLSPRLALESTAATDQPPAAPHRLSAKAIRADIWLTSLVAAFSASAALGAIGTEVGACTSGGSRMLGIAFATVTGIVLLLRARSHNRVARSVPLIASGTVTLSIAVVVAATAYPLHTLWLVGAAAMLATAALALGFIAFAMTLSPIGHRSVELLEYLALAAIVPLACWICGLYTIVRGLNLS
jgi:type VII secretion integral membrane protein EccD